MHLDSRGRDRAESQTSFEGEESLTIQSDAPLADMKHILRQFASGGLVKSLDGAELEYLDISEFTDFADAMQMSKVAEMEFMKLPSKVREIFNHKVEEWLDTAHDDDKRAALVKAGFMDAPTDPDAAVGSAAVSEIPATAGSGGEGESNSSAAAPE